jgi:hypothetical protein
MRFQEQRVAGLQDDVADLLVDALAAARHGDDDGVVERAELAVADRLADDRAAVRHDRFDQASVRARRVELEDLIRRGSEPADLLQVDDGADDADEDEAVFGAQHDLGGDGRDDLAVTLDFSETYSGLAQPRLLDGLAANAPFGSTSISTEYSRGSPNCSATGRRSGNSQRLNAMTNRTPAIVIGIPIHVSSNMCMLRPLAEMSMPLTSRFVAVEMMVTVPLSTAA